MFSLFNRRKSVLIVDTESLSRRNLAAEVRKLGHRATEAADSAEALRLLAGGKYDLVVSDASLALLESARRVSPATPVLLTTEDVGKWLYSSIRKGAVGVFEKPLDVQALADCIRSILGSDKKQTAA